MKISTMHLDILKEIGNIGAAHAATSLSGLLGKKIDMRVPNVEMVSFTDMMELAGSSEKVVVGIYLRIEGDVEGSMFFVLPIEQANRFIRRLIHDEQFDFSNNPVSEIGLSAMQELGNILSGSYLSALSDFTGLKIYPSVPGLSVDMFGAIVSIGVKIVKTSEQSAVDSELINELVNTIQQLNEKEQLVLSLFYTEGNDPNRNWGNAKSIYITEFHKSIQKLCSNYASYYPLKC
ncbi:hypothetical protein UACE39S_01525 [Ureibacillus acetophenoni]